MEPLFIGITGARHYQGTQLAKKGMTVRLVKEPDNAYDEEAILVELPPFGKIGYVANSVHTVPKGCRSAGRIYDAFHGETTGVIRFVVNDTMIVELTVSRRGEDLHINEAVNEHDG